MAASDQPLAQRLLDGDKRALAKAITLVENDDPAGWELVREVFPRTGRAAVFGFTGPPGVGKSTLLAALTKLERERERTVAVLSIDPSSPFTKGALLGDRIRLAEHFLDPGVFIRSMANRGALGGLSEAALQAALLMDASGRDVVLLETVGVGQAEVDIIDHADTVVLVLMPGLGRLDPGPQGGGDGDPRRDRRQQGRPPADRHDGQGDKDRPVARARTATGRCRSSAPRRSGARACLRWPRRWRRIVSTSRRRERCQSDGGAT